MSSSPGFPDMLEEGGRGRHAQFGGFGVGYCQRRKPAAWIKASPSRLSGGAQSSQGNRAIRRPIDARHAGGPALTVG
jgi:hypothetical protein